MTGAPIRGVTALRGMMPMLAGRLQRMLQRRAMAEPHSMVAGSKHWWFSVPSSRRAMCGVASPINETGPQKAVVMAVSMPVITSNRLRVRCVLMPILSAYCSPRSMALRGLMSIMAAISPRMVIAANTGICDIDTPPKSPIPQMA